MIKTRKQKRIEKEQMELKKKQKELEAKEKRQENKKKGFFVISIIVAILFFLLGITVIPAIGAIVFFVEAVFALPIKPIRDLWEKLPVKGKWLKPVVLVIAFFVATGLSSSYIMPKYDLEPSVVVEGDLSETEPEIPLSIEEEPEIEKTTEEEPAEPEVTEPDISEQESTEPENTVEPQFDLASVPAYSGNPYVTINDNIPYFTDAELSEATMSYETYSDLDDLGRCGVCIASVGQDIMPTEERGSIGSVKPTGWHTVKYNGVVDGNYLYNRCHLLGYQLTAENANTKNLITGTRYLNVDGMLPFENMVADYVSETNNHVLYRVTPIFEGDNLVANGVLMEAKSVEDNGDGVLFNIFAYNVQPGVSINYANGDSELDGTIAQQPEEEKTTESASVTESTSVEQNTTASSDGKEIMVWITDSGKKYHSKSGCSNMKNPKQVTESEAIGMGYEACKKCH